MNRLTRNILTGAGSVVVAVGAAAVVSYTITRKLLAIAMDRDIPDRLSASKGRERLTGSPEITEFVGAVSEGAGSLASRDQETVTIESHDGLRLVGHWVPRKKPKRVIVAMHGWRSTWKQDFGAISDFWYDSGCSVLYAEQRGQGESGGKYMGFGMLERYDALGWINWVNEKTGGRLPIYLCGVSMGATTVLMAAGLELPDNVKGIIADCGFTSPQAIWKHVIEKNLHLPYRIHAAAASDLCKKRINMSSKAYSTVDAMKQCAIPVLFIHGSDDKFVPIDMTYENYKACSAEKQLLVVPGAGHAMSYFIEKEKYEKTVTDFWNCLERQ